MNEHARWCIRNGTQCLLPAAELYSTPTPPRYNAGLVAECFGSERMKRLVGAHTYLYIHLILSVQLSRDETSVWSVHLSVCIHSVRKQVALAHPLPPQ